MGYLRFWRRVRIAPGVTINLAKRGLSSVSFGVRGAHYTIGRDGKRRMTVGLPGTGLFYTKQQQAARQQQAAPAQGGWGPVHLWLLLLFGALLFFWLGVTWVAALLAVAALFPIGRMIIWGISQPYRREIQRGNGAVVEADPWEIVRGSTEYGARVSVIKSFETTGQVK